MDNVKTSGRTVCISDEVLRKVAALAAADVAGVVRLSGERTLRNPLAHPVQIRNLGGAISVKISVIVSNGCRAAAVAKQVQHAVKQGIQDMTGVTAVHVNVEIAGMDADI